MNGLEDSLTPFARGWSDAEICCTIFKMTTIPCDSTDREEKIPVYFSGGFVEFVVFEEIVPGEPMQLVRRKTRRSWAWLSGVFDSFGEGRGEGDCFCDRLPFCCE